MVKYHQEVGTAEWIQWANEMHIDSGHIKHEIWRMNHYKIIGEMETSQFEQTKILWVCKS